MSPFSIMINLVTCLFKFAHNILLFLILGMCTKYVYIKSTTVYVRSSKLGLQPLSRQLVCPYPRNQRGGGGHTRQGVRGWGSTKTDDWRKSLALCLLCGHVKQILERQLCNFIDITKHVYELILYLQNTY